jgi:death-on-curing protein
VTWRWVDEEVALAIHGEQLAEHGGSQGVRDLGLLQSALARPKNFIAYEAPPPDAARLAACYAFGIVKDHPFVDGNKRVALVVAELFLDLNGFELTSNDASCVTAVEALADGRMAEEHFASWIRDNLAPLELDSQESSSPTG